MPVAVMRIPKNRLKGSTILPGDDGLPELDAPDDVNFDSLPSKFDG